MPAEHFQQIDRVAGDLVSAAAVVATFLGFLPAIAAAGAFVWYGVQIWESKTVQKWARHRRLRHHKRRVKHE